MVDPLRQVAERRAEFVGDLLEARRPRRIGLRESVGAGSPDRRAGVGPCAVESGDEDERVEQGLLGPIVGRRLLRVPLHAEHPGRPLVLLVLDGSFERLDEPVRAPARRLEPVADAVDALVMMRTTGQSAALGERRQPAAGEWLDVVHRFGLVDRNAVRQEAWKIGQVRMQRATERDVHHLHASTDAQRRRRRGVGGVQQRDLEFVALGVDSIQMVGCRSVVARRVDVPAAGEQEPVERLEHVFDGARLSRRHQDRPSACSVDRFDVRRRDAEAALRPATHAVAVQRVGHDPDQRDVSHRRRRLDELGEPLEEAPPAFLVRVAERDRLGPKVLGAAAPLGDRAPRRRIRRSTPRSLIGRPRNGTAWPTCDPRAGRPGSRPCRSSPAGRPRRGARRCPCATGTRARHPPAGPGRDPRRPQRSAGSARSRSREPAPGAPTSRATTRAPVRRSRSPDKGAGARGSAGSPRAPRTGMAVHRRAPC